MADRPLLDSFLIRGFRAFDELTLPRLGRVHLLVGPNSVGKSTVLEALELWASGSARAGETLRDILVARHEVPPSADGTDRHTIHWRRAFHSNTDETRRRFFALGPLDATNQLTITEGYHEWHRESGGEVVLRFAKTRSKDAFETEPGLRIKGRTTHIVGLSRLGNSRFTAFEPPAEPNAQCVVLPARGLMPDAARHFWDQVLLTEHAAVVIDAMRLICPDIERLSFVEITHPLVRHSMGYSRRELRLPMVKRRGRPIEPLKALGDGVNRLLELTLALVSARDGLLLIDEVENGIHYRVQPDLWRLLFTVAADLNVQIFAATHSWDCIRAFQQAAAAHPAEGMLIRLERDDFGSRAKLFDEDDLATVTEAEIDVR